MFFLDTLEPVGVSCDTSEALNLTFPWSMTLPLESPQAWQSCQWNRYRTTITSTKPLKKKKNQHQSHSHELEKSLHPQACNLIWNNDQCGLYSDEVFCFPQFDSFSLCNIFKMNPTALSYTKFRQNQPQSFVPPVLGDRLSFPSPDIVLFSLPLSANFSKSRIQEWIQSFFFHVLFFQAVWHIFRIQFCQKQK